MSWARSKVIPLESFTQRAVLLLERRHTFVYIYPVRLIQAVNRLVYIKSKLHCTFSDHRY